MLGVWICQNDTANPRTRDQACLCPVKKGEREKQRQRQTDTLTVKEREIMIAMELDPVWRADNSVPGAVLGSECTNSSV